MTPLERQVYPREQMAALLLRVLRSVRGVLNFYTSAKWLFPDNDEVYDGTKNKYQGQKKGQENDAYPSSPNGCICRHVLPQRDNH